MTRLAWRAPKRRIRHRVKSAGGHRISVAFEKIGRGEARISYDTRLFVWRRDGGACRHCGADDDLQFDHVIPVALGGANVASNVELLCGAFNREKSARLFSTRRLATEAPKPGDRKGEA